MIYTFFNVAKYDKYDTENVYVSEFFKRFQEKVICHK